MKVDESVVLAAFLLLFLAVVWLRRSYTEDRTEDRTEDYSPKSIKVESFASSEKDFYSLYGWRTDPPFKYPQSTINTPYDETMEKCVEANRFQLQEPGEWQDRCSLAAAQAQRNKVL